MDMKAEQKGDKSDSYKPYGVVSKKENANMKSNQALNNSQYSDAQNRSSDKQKGAGKSS